MGLFDIFRWQTEAWKNEMLAEMRRQATENNEKRQAFYKSYKRAIKDGVLVRASNCEQCGIATYTDGHHDDYNQPLKVRWLCKSCHSKQHTSEMRRRFL